MLGRSLARCSPDDGKEMIASVSSSFPCIFHVSPFTH